MTTPKRRSFRAPTIVALLVLVGSVGFFGSTGRLGSMLGIGPHPCADTTLNRILARAVTLSNPVLELPQIRNQLPENVQKFVQRHAVLFAADGSATRCANLLGRAFVGQAMATYDRDARNRAHDIAWRAGAPAFADQVARDANAAANDLFHLGVQLQWLATVFPAMAAGNDQPYVTTGGDLREMNRAQLAGVQMAMNATGAGVDLITAVVLPIMELQERIIVLGALLLARS